MTNEEAIKELSERYEIGKKEYMDNIPEYVEALRMGISALEENEQLKEQIKTLKIKRALSTDFPENLKKENEQLKARIHNQKAYILELKSELEQPVKKWDFVIDAYGELKEFICDCGHGSLCASKYCPSCGSKMDDSDYEYRLKEAFRQQAGK